MMSPRDQIERFTNALENRCPLLTKYDSPGDEFSRSGLLLQNVEENDATPIHPAVDRNGNISFIVIFNSYIAANLAAEALAFLRWIEGVGPTIMPRGHCARTYSIRFSVPYARLFELNEAIDPTEEPLR